MDETIQQLDGRITTVVSSIFALQVRLTAHREHQPRHDKVLRLLPLNVTRHQARRIGQLYFHRNFLSISQDIDLRCLAGVLLRNKVSECNALPRAEGYGAIVGHLDPIKAHNDVVRLEHFSCCRTWVDAADQHALVFWLHFVRASERGRLHPLPLDSEHRKSCELLVADKVGQEMEDHRRGDDVADVLHFPCHGLKRNTHAFSQPVEHRTAAIPAVDGGVNLDAQ
mmetsp:Transcript_27479/g.48979  ORF Transcript_27479/g.48979 Transcript_27479/m.48979 type:complete len:225 (-) Transcript_27479:663-1337(-)